MCQRFWRERKKKIYIYKMRVIWYNSFRTHTCKGRKWKRRTEGEGAIAWTWYLGDRVRSSWLPCNSHPAQLGSWGRRCWPGRCRRQQLAALSRSSLLLCPNPTYHVYVGPTNTGKVYHPHTLLDTWTFPNITFIQTFSNTGTTENVPLASWKISLSWYPWYDWCPGFPNPVR